MNNRSILLCFLLSIFLGSCFQKSSDQSDANAEIPNEKQVPVSKKDFEIKKEAETPNRRDDQSYRVVNVGDGDTIRVEKDGEKFTIRFACIDAPELKQIPFGDQSKQRLQAILPVDAVVTLKQQTVDRYDRVVAEVFKNGANVNLALVAEGQAVVYRQYLNQCDAEQYLAAEETAKSEGLAFWSQSNPIIPWDFRRGDRKPSIQTKQSETTDLTCDRAYPEVYIPPAPPDLDCGDISHQLFKVVGDDSHRFDGDRNGLGCEG